MQQMAKEAKNDAEQPQPTNEVGDFLLRRLEEADNQLRPATTTR